ncbi:MAG TPA: protein kinase [Candidatus Binataceae bacterium]|nr:protein kinase [Candidatus Binataceae bacterium]
MISANTIVGSRYRVVKALGGGGMKLVYLAEDLRLAARPCALAEMVDSITNPQMQSQAVAAFQREADMLAELNNEHIPRIYDRFNEQNRHYLVMEFVDGVTLEEALKAAGGKLEQERVVEIALQILDTLDYLHNLEPAVIYRDLKPSNVMLTPGGQVKLIDFGIARHFQPLSNATMIGTQGYAPPEQYRGKVEARSDLYALGATMHHALTGRDPTTEPPFSFPPLKKAMPEISAALADLVDNALSYDVEKRIASAGEFKRRLIAIQLGATNGSSAAEASPIVLGSTPQATAPGKPQLKLPLGTPASSGSIQPPPSPSALTMQAPARFACPGCGKQIPLDSRFCSYCAADLRQVQVLQPHDVVNPQAETIRLPEPEEMPNTRDRLAYGGHRAFRRRHRSGLPFFALLAMFFAAFVLVRLLPYVLAMIAALGANGANGSPRPESEASRPGYSAPDAPEAPEAPEVEPESSTPRAMMLRRTLVMQGYRNVHFRLEGQNIDLWGAVPTEADRLMVETLAFTITGAVSLNDHIKVTNSFAGP